MALAPTEAPHAPAAFAQPFKWLSKRYPGNRLLERTLRLKSMLPASPRQLYHHVWLAVPYFFHDIDKLKDWQEWEHKFDADIATDADAIRFANEMIASLGDPYSRLISREERESLERDIDTTGGSTSPLTPLRYERYEDIGHIQFDNFLQTDLVDQMALALKELEGAIGYIVNVKDSIGGFMDRCIELCSLFMDEGEVLRVHRRLPGSSYVDISFRINKENITETSHYEGSRRVTTRVYARRPNLSAGKKIVVLINGRTFSAGEVFAAALQDNGRAAVVGEKTGGKGVGQLTVAMPNGTMLIITVQRHMRPSGVWIGDGVSVLNGVELDHHIGFRHDLILPFCESIGPGDSQFKFAVDLLGKMSAV